LKRILKSGHGTPKNLQTNDGTEFFNSSFEVLIKSYRIIHYSTFSTLKASIVERFKRTLKELMWREFSFNGKYKWIDMNEQLINKHNNRVHRIIKSQVTSILPMKNKYNKQRTIS